MTIQWNCHACGNRAWNLNLSPWGDEVKCAYCGERESRPEWYRLAMFGTPLPDPTERATRVATEGRWVCVSCFGLTHKPVLGPTSIGLTCADCGTPEGDPQMRQLAGVSA